MKALRTPEARFADLPDYPWSPHYVECDAQDGTGDRLRVHYLDEGPAGSDEVVLLLHGGPAWSFLYRKVIPPLVAAGHRCVAPDLVGFGRSDKPAARADYTYERHFAWLSEVVFEQLDLQRVTLVCQAWGGQLGIRLLAADPVRFRRVVAANALFPTGDFDLGEAWRTWVDYSQQVPELSVGDILQTATVTELPPDVIAAYDAPFPDESYKAGARQFPQLVPDRPDAPGAAENRAAWDFIERFHKPFLCLFSDQDQYTAGADRGLRSLIPGTLGQAHRTLEDAGHFLQEDVPDEFAQGVLDLIAATPSSSLRPHP